MVLPVAQPQQHRAVDELLIGDRHRLAELGIVPEGTEGVAVNAVIAVLLARISALSGLRTGLVCFSSPKVAGTVAVPLARAACTSATRV